MPSWKKVLISGSDGALRSLTVTQGITGSLFGTSSWAVSSSVATTSSYALTASYALNGGGGGGPAFPYIGTAQITGSLQVSGTVAITNSFTASGLIYPSIDGIAGQVVTTDGAGNLTLSNVENTAITLKNMTTASIAKGTPCYITGSGTSGNVAGIVPADAANPARMPAGVIAGELIASGAEGVGYINGFISGVNTSAFAAGDEVYVAVGGGYTNVRPTGSAILVQKLGNVEKVHPSNGSGVINGPGYYNDVPNIQQGFTWVGDSTGVAVPIATSSIQNVVSSSFAISSSRAVTSSFAISSSFATTSSFAITSSFTVSSSFATTSSFTLSSSFATTSSFTLSSSFAVSSSRAVTSSFATTSSFTISSSFAATSLTAATASQVTNTVAGTDSADLVYGTMGSNDLFRIRIGGTGIDGGFAEIATADAGNEPIYVRQYTGTNAFTTIARTATLLDGSGNTQFPGTVSASSFLGPLTGTASFAATSSFVTASNVFGPFGSNSILSSSFAVSSSRAATSITATTSSVVTATVTGTNSADLVYGNMADNDFFRIRVGGTATDAGFAEIATADGGNEPIHVRQYTGTFSTLTRTATLLDGSGNTQFPGSVSASSFLGPLTGTASFAATSSFVTASNVFGPFGSNSILSSSFAVSSSRAATSSFATTSSFVTGSNIFGPFGSNSVTSASFAISSSFAISASFAPVFPFSGSARITGSLGVTGSNSITGSLGVIGSATVSGSALITGSLSIIGSALITGSLGVTGSIFVTQNISSSRAFLSGSNSTLSGSILTVYGSSSAQPVFTVQGSQGELFSVTDSLSGSLFSVNDISGLPILEVISDGTTLIGNYQDPMLITTAKNVLTNSGSFVVYSLPTASYDTAFFEYSVRSGSNARAGQIMAIQSGSSVNYTETTTTNFGTTSGLALGVFVSGSNMVLTGSASTTAWTIKSIIKAL